jgi:hypothetical protein
MPLRFTTLHRYPVGRGLSPPSACACPAHVKDKAKSLAISRNLVGAANDTKWDELLEFFREMDGWAPCYRSKTVGGVISGWDTEWFCHLPFPFMRVEWFDIALEEVIWRGALLPREVIDHSGLILTKLKEIGFEFEAREGTVRIWGYLPKCYEDFPPTWV